MSKNLIYKKWCSILIIIVVAILAVGCNANKNDKFEQKGTTTNEQTPESKTEQNIETSSKETVKSKQTKKEKISKKSANGLSPEFKKAMDSYEKFMNEYCNFMKRYAKSDGTDLELLNDYADYMSKYNDVLKDFEAWDNEELTTEEASYYLDVQTRINKKLLKVSE